VWFRYPERHGFPALEGINLRVEEGECVALVGPNGAGKSTFCRLINGLLLPNRGKVITCGMDTADPSSLAEIRRCAALVLQNPDNQIIGATAEDDVAFGLENFAIPQEEMRLRVEEALASMHLTRLRHREPHLLSMGEKKRLNLACALAMRPRLLVSDESTSMLDPPTRSETFCLISRLREKTGMTVIHATHQPEEIMACDRVLVLQEGRLVFDGGPGEFFEKGGPATEIGLRPPALFLLARELQAKGIPMPRRVLRAEEVAESLWASS